MRYHLEIHELTVQNYLRGLALSRNARLRVYCFILDLRLTADRYRAEPTRRLGPESPYFGVDFPFRNDGQINRLLLVLDDSAARMGILRLVYTELFSEP